MKRVEDTVRRTIESKELWFFIDTVGCLLTYTTPKEQQIQRSGKQKKIWMHTTTQTRTTNQF